MGKRPLIGITPGFLGDKNRLFVGKGYMDGVTRAGGFAVILPLACEVGLMDEILDRCDGFLLSGGPDIDAKYFNEPNLQFAGEISPFRDFLELYIARKAVEKNKPVLGICRGSQVLNVALGGSLFQDIYAQVSGVKLLKHSQEAPDWYPTHTVSLENGSKIRECFKSGRIEVNSFHHQAIKDPGKGMKISAHSPDGIIEAIEHESHIFAIGVQWHPELMWQENAEFLKLFEEFVRAAERGEYHGR